MTPPSNPYAEAHDRRALAQLNDEFEGAPMTLETLAGACQRAQELGLGRVRFDALGRRLELVPRTDAAPGPSVARFG